MIAIDQLDTLVALGLSPRSGDGMIRVLVVDDDPKAVELIGAHVPDAKAFELRYEARDRELSNLEKQIIPVINEGEKIGRLLDRMQRLGISQLADIIIVDDEGPGVPEESREAIFNRFHSVRPESEHFGRHTGLGLAIARAIVEGHDGEIDVQDRDDAPSGARFTIRLPAAEAL